MSLCIFLSNIICFIALICPSVEYHHAVQPRFRLDGCADLGIHVWALSAYIIGKGF